MNTAITFSKRTTKHRGRRTNRSARRVPAIVIQACESGRSYGSAHPGRISVAFPGRPSWKRPDRGLNYIIHPWKCCVLRDMSGRDEVYVWIWLLKGLSCKFTRENEYLLLYTVHLGVLYTGLGHKTHGSYVLLRQIILQICFLDYFCYIKVLHVSNVISIFLT